MVQVVANLLKSGSEHGYTIIEVMIVLAITGILFFSAYSLFNGQQGETEFAQAMHDLDSKIQSYATDVSSGALPNGQSYPCSAASGRPVLDTTAGSGLGINQDCLFLGKAIQLTTNSSNLTVYTVLGDRTIHNGVSDTGVVATSLADANPEPALDTRGADVWRDNYTIEGGATVLSSKVAGSSAEYDLIGLYNNLKTSGTSSTLSGQAYQLKNTTKACIENDSACLPTSTNQWSLCLQSGDGRQTASLSVNILPTGLTTRLNFASCS